MSVSPRKGWKGVIKVDGSDVVRVESATIDISRNLDSYYEIGSHQPTELLEGNEEITGTINRAWIDLDMLDLILTAGGDLTEFTLYLSMGTDTNSPYVYLYNCKLEGSSLDAPQDSVWMNNVDFRAKTWAKGQVP